MPRFCSPLSAIRVLALGIALLAVAAGPAPAPAADVPATLSYQGTLTDATGQPVTGSHQVQVRLYGAAAGGTAFWTETRQVDLLDGRLAITLGAEAGNPLDPDAFDGETYISLQVDDDTEMPTQPFSSVAYAFKAADSVPRGVIVMWSGSIDSIPDGWALCDGTDGTPNLQDRFIVGAGAAYSVGAAGGASANNISHNHSIPTDRPETNSTGSHLHSGTTGGMFNRTGNRSNSYDEQDDQDDHQHQFVTDAAGAHSHVVNTHNHSGATGTAGSSSLENRPPYYALAYIMKL